METSPITIMGHNAHERHKKAPKINNPRVSIDFDAK